MISVRCKLAIGAVLFWVALWSGGGCDMPVADKSNAPRQPKILLGPYLSVTDDGSTVMHFTTNRSCVAGLSYEGSLHGRTERFSSFNANHEIVLRDLQSGERRSGRILLDSLDAGPFSVRGQPALGGRVELAFAGGNVDPASAAAAGDLLRGLSLDGLFFSEPPLSADADLEQWKKLFFDAFGDVAASTPLFFAPGALRDVPEELLRGSRAAAWSRNLGCVHVVGLDAAALAAPQTSAETVAWLRRDIVNRKSSALWTVVLLNRPMFSAKYVNARALNAIGAVLESAGVNLVISGGSGYYHRTLPVGDEAARTVRYISLGTLGRAEDPGSGREYTAAVCGEKHVAVLLADQGGLEFRVVSLNTRRVVDSIKLAAGGADGSGEPRIGRKDVLTDALATLALRNEVVAVARQACRAVIDPAGDNRLTLRITNPSPRKFAGTLSWAAPEGGAYAVNPARQSFDLGPGQMTEVAFAVKPAGGNVVPVLTVDAGEVGYVKQPLVLAKLVTAEVPRVSGSPQIDGYPNESLWKNAAELTGFAVLGTGQAPQRMLRCWLAACDTGLCVMMRCETDNPSAIKTAVKDNDGPVYLDESVEVFADPSCGARDFYNFSVNIRGKRLDRSSRHGLAFNPQWESEVQYGSAADGVGYYDVEMLIPYRALGLSQPPAPGDRWAVDLTRNDYHDARKAVAAGQSAAPCQVVQWAPTYGSNARSGCYGIIAFFDPAARAKAEAEKKTASEATTK